MLEILQKQCRAVETPTGQTILNMMRDYSEEQSRNQNINSDVIRGFQMLIQYVKTVRVRYEAETERK